MGEDIVTLYILWYILWAVLTAASYMFVPAMIRFIVGQLSPKRARSICIINCVVVTIVWLVILFLIGADSANLTAAFVWFFPSYFWLRKKPSKTTEQANDQKREPTIAQDSPELIEEDEHIDEAEESAADYVDQPLYGEQPEVVEQATQDFESKPEKPSCPHCNKEISEEHQFCPHCGKKAVKQLKKTFFTTETAFIILVVAAIALILTIILAVVIPGCASSGSSEGEVTTAKKYSYYIGNKSTKIYHDPDCKYLPSKTNQVKIQKNISGKRTLSDYEPCWHCQPEPPDID